MCVSLGERRMSHHAWASFYVIFCQKKVFMARRAGNSFNYAFNFFFCRTVLWLTLKLSTYFYSLWLHLYNPLLKKSWEFFTSHSLLCSGNVLLWAWLFDREYYYILISPHCYHSNIEMLSLIKCVPGWNGRNITFPVFNFEQKVELGHWQPSRGD